MILLQAWKYLGYRVYCILKQFSPLWPKHRTWAIMTWSTASWFYAIDRMICIALDAGPPFKGNIELWLLVVAGGVFNHMIFVRTSGLQNLLDEYGACPENGSRVGKILVGLFLIATLVFPIVVSYYWRTHLGLH